ncbi:MAG: phosphotransferase [Solirubrobacteraceae bacterium]
MTEPGDIVGKLEPELGRAAGPPEPLDGGITNRNFRVRFGTRECVLRLPGASTGLLGIDREAERLASTEAARLRIAPALVAAGEGYLVTEFVDGEPIDSDQLRAAPASAAHALRAFHDSKLSLPTRFWVPELLAEYERIVGERGGSVPQTYARAQTLAADIADALPLTDPVPCHNDLLGANVLARRSRAGGTDLILVDWEYAGTGHRVFDLGNLAVNNDFDTAAEDRLLEAYYGEAPSPGRRAALGLMRIMSDAREGAWGVVQGVISELDFDFAGYARRHFARLERAASGPDLEHWLRVASAEPPVLRPEVVG